MSSIFNLFRSSSASDFSLPYARKTADWNIVLWLLVPAWLLFWLWTNPPHGFDLAFEHQFYVNLKVVQNRHDTQVKMTF